MAEVERVCRATTSTSYCICVSFLSDTVARFFRKAITKLPNVLQVTANPPPPSSITLASSLFITKFNHSILARYPPPPK